MHIITGSNMNQAVRAAGLLRRLAALFYDSLLIIALLFVATIPPTLINGGAIHTDETFKSLALAIYLLIIWFLFYGWFWTHGGQTLGMSAWHIKVITVDGGTLSWRGAGIRWSTALLGLANLSSFFNKQGRGWHEQLSNSRTILIGIANPADAAQ